MFLESSIYDNQFPSSVRRFWKVSGKSNLKRIVREIYFRSDIGCGVNECNKCIKSKSQGILNDFNENVGTLDPKTPLLLLTTEIFMKHFDVCEKYLKNCVVPVTVSNEVRRRSLNVYGGIKKLVQNTNYGGYYVFSNENFKETYVEERPGENVNERDNRAIYECALWYSRHLPNQEIFLVTVPNSTLHNKETGNGDVDMDRGMNLRVVDLYELYDLYPENLEGMMEHLPSRTTEKVESEKGIYPEHLTEEEIKEGVEKGRLFIGTLHMYIGSYQRGYVSCGKEEFKVSSLMNLNRSLDGDQVVVEIIERKELKTDMEDEEEGDNEESKKEDLSVKDIEDKTGKESKDLEIIDAHMEPEQFKVIKRECRVVGIIKRNRKEFCGSLLPVENVNMEGYTERLFVPVDARIPFISIETKRSKQLENKRIVVGVDEWKRTSKRPQGHWTEIIGEIDDREVESEVILREHEVITEDFNIKSYKELSEIIEKLIKIKKGKRTHEEIEMDNNNNNNNDNNNYNNNNNNNNNNKDDDDEEVYDIEVTKEVLEGRIDYRKELVFSVDPPGCKDIDDALGCKKLKNGNYEVSVHIADVTHFIPENSNLDKEASERCTTVYLVDRRTDMLPKLLTTNLCSLMENVNRLTFSVYWEIDESGVIINTKFGKSIIKSKKALSYREAQELIDSKSNNEMCKALRSLNGLAKIFREQRMKRGAIELESSEVKFEFDIDRVTNLESYKIYETNKMVEEFMLLANISVATKIFEHYPKFSLLRIHPPPIEEKLNELKRTLEQHNIYQFKYGNSKQLNESLDMIKNEKNEKFVSATKMLTTRTMSQAVYKNSNDLKENEFKHYGLCCEYYTHFTSPIRRYADVVVHRLLSGALNLTSISKNLIENMTNQCDVLNKKHRNAQWCSRESDKMFSYLYFKNKDNVETTGIVLDINEDRVVVLTYKYGIEAVAEIKQKSFDKVNKTLVDENGEEFKVFDQVKIRLYTSNKHFRNLIKAEIISHV